MLRHFGSSPAVHTFQASLMVRGGVHDTRWASRAVGCIQNGLPLGAHASHSPVEFRCALLLEICCGSGSTWCRHQAHSFDGYAMRVLPPRSNRKRSLRNQRRVSTRKCPRAPLLRKGAVASWRLDVRASGHQESLLRFVRGFRLPPDVQVAHLHTSPSCRIASSIGNLLENRGDDLVCVLRESLFSNSVEHCMRHGPLDPCARVSKSAARMSKQLDARRHVLFESSVQRARAEFVQVSHGQSQKDAPE